MLLCPDKFYDIMANLIICIDYGHGDTVASYVDLSEENRDPKPLNINIAQEKALKKISSVIHGIPKMSNPTEYNYNLDWTIGKVFAYFKGRINRAVADERRDAFGEFVKQVYYKLIANNRDVFYTENNELRDFKLYIAAPTKWTYEEKQEYKHFIEDALNHPIEWIINESDAAFYCLEPVGNVLIIDYGSSTMDYTLMIDNKKAPIDKLANQLGASRIENEMLMKLQLQNEYGDIYSRTRDKLNELGYDYIEPNDWLKLILRNNKETYYNSLRRDRGIDSIQQISCNVVYRAQPDRQYRTNDYNFSVEFDFTEGTKEYREEVKADLSNLKIQIQQYLGDKPLNRVVLSGGASQMPWFEELCGEIFGDMQSSIVRDVNNCSYVVSDGIARYAVEQIQCLNELNAEMDRLTYKTDFYKDAYEEARKQAIIACIEDPLKTVCDQYAAAKEDRTVRNFIEDIKVCFKNVIDDNTCQQIFRDRFQEIMMKEISVKVTDVLRNHFNVDRIEFTDPVEFDGTLDVNRLSGFYGKLEEVWFKEVYESEDVKECRDDEFKDNEWSKHGYLAGKIRQLCESAGRLDIDKSRREPMRRLLAGKLHQYVLSGKADFSGEADSSTSEDDEEKTFWDQLESYAKKCAEQLFYRNELFDTKFKINNEHQ